MKDGDKLMHAQLGACVYLLPLDNECCLVRLANGVEASVSNTYLIPLVPATPDRDKGRGKGKGAGRDNDE